VRRGGHRRRRDTEQPPGRWVVAVALAVSPSPSRHWLPRRKRRPHRRVRCTGSRLRGCGCRGCPNACCAVRRLSASRCPVSGVRCPRVRCPVSGVRCPRVRWRVCRGVRCGASVSARLASASALSARAGSCGARRCGAAPRFGTGDFAVVARPCPRAAGRLPKSGAIGAVEAVLGRAETSAADLAAVLGCARAAAAATFDRLPTRTAGWRRGSPVGWLKDHGGGAVRATFAHVLDGYAGRQGQDYGHEARP
jgi:hypothetical protein